MEGFRNYLLSRHLTSPKGVEFYLHWVIRCYEYLRKKPGEAVSKQEMEGFLHSLSKSREEWQTDQAQEAIKLFQFYEKRKITRPVHKSLSHKAQMTLPNALVAKKGPCTRCWRYQKAREIKPFALSGRPN
jgi:hypothetical protein